MASKFALPVVRVLAVCLLVAVAGFIPVAGRAQGFAGGGQNWSASWGFISASDRSIALQQAQMIRNAENGADPTAVYNTYNDNRYNYIDTTNPGDGTVNADLHIGDEIGTNTNSVGAMNTGSTTITLDGDNNSIVADNTADSAGCVDGSVTAVTPTPLPGFYLNADLTGATVYTLPPDQQVNVLLTPVTEAETNVCH